ncbi:hypothetical protein KP509_05G083100 [Ceratopteris richardii]|uniref:Uncharacterized protein n=1 Tax=Ceratopteris richardii TaxID=49495 RepID=A0A8T2UNC5_CERRI|nr:hypothetical protein KP509_05G083100 [Ceratopteris richardii]KAH7437662.1 hypothetical protein KP509_05G083100 [Ceratopteris richardii]
MVERAAVLYHYPCPDGAFAALAAHLYHSIIGVPAVFFPNPVYNPIKVKDVDAGTFDVFYLLDFVGPKGFATELCSKAKKVIVLDHHKTAYEELSSKCPSNLVKNFDMKRSGATLAFDYFTDQLQQCKNTVSDLHVATMKEPSKGLTLVDEQNLLRVRCVFDYIEDADLWKWNLPQSKAFSSGLRSLNIEYNVNINVDMFQQLLSLEAASVIAIGEKVLLSNQIRIDAAIQSSFILNLGQGSFGKCLAVESDDMADLRSELGHQLAARSLSLGLRLMVVEDMLLQVPSC